MSKLVNWKTQKLVKLLRQQADKTAERLAKNVRGHIRDEVPVDTGNLRDATIIAPFKKTVTMTKTTVGSDLNKAPYTPFVFYGLPNGIRPKKASVLRFVTKSGTVVYTKFVKPRAGNNWLSRALPKAYGDVAQILTQTVLEINGFRL